MQKCQKGLRTLRRYRLEKLKKLSKKQRLIQEQAQLIKKEKESKVIFEDVENLK